MTTALQQVQLVTATVKLFLKKQTEKPQQLIWLVPTHATQSRQLDRFQPCLIFTTEAASVSEMGLVPQLQLDIATIAAMLIKLDLERLQLMVHRNMQIILCDLGIE